MKKFTLLFVFALASSLFLASCSSGDDNTTSKPKPSINWKGGATYTSSNTSVAAGNSIDFGINATASSGEKITRILVTLNANGTGALALKDSTLKEATVNVDWFGVQVGTLPGAKLVYTASVTQSNGESSSVTFTITVTSAGKVIQSRANLQMGGQTNSTLGSFFSYQDQQAYLLGQANGNPGNIDIIYFEGSSNKNSFASPDDNQVTQVFASVSNWKIRNNTRFRKTSLTATQFDGLTDGSPAKPIEDQAAITAGLSSIAPQLKVGDVLVFITAGGSEFGLLKVVKINVGGAGDITFDLKITG